MAKKAMDKRILVSTVSGHVVAEDVDGNVLFDIACVNTIHATMLKVSLLGHGIGMQEKGQYIRPPKKDKGK